MKIGNGKGNTSNFTRKNFKLGDGDQVFRILPGLGDLADTNRWSMHYGVHWGYKTLDGKKKPFASPEKRNNKTKTIDITDAAKERIESLKAKLEEAKSSGNTAALSKLNTLVGREGIYNLDSNHHMNVITLDGNIGVLKIRHKCKVVLDDLISKLEASGTYPLSPNDGRFFVFTRTGMGNQTSFSVSVLQEEINVENYGKVKRDVVHVLTDSIINRLDKEATELDKLFPRPTSEQVEKIVQTSDLMTGVSSYLSELYSKSVAATASEDNSGSTETTTTVSAAKTTVAVPVSSVTSVPKPAVSLVSNNQTTATPASVTTKAPVSLADMSTADFLAALNDGTL